MKYTYFPGCAGHSTARDQDLSTRALFEALDVPLHELEDWNCCGATPGHTVGGDLALLLSIQNLCIASDTEQDLLVPCASCFGNLKKSAHAVKHGVLPSVVDEQNIQLPKRHVQVLSIVTALSNINMLERIKPRVSADLSGLKIAPYYGCLLIRPSETTETSDSEDPNEMESVIEICGAQTVSWPHKTDCCGGPNTISHPETVSALSSRLVDKAQQFGADAIVTACPMCHASLETAQWERKRARVDTEKDAPSRPVPVLYLTELVASALGVPRQNRWLKRHLIDPRPLLKTKGGLK